MTFTDENLKRLKWALENHAPNWADKDNLNGLIARLEAAELLIRLADLKCECVEGMQCACGYEAWRKAAGKRETGNL